MNKAHVLNCAFYNWFPKFAEISIESEIIDVNNYALEYITSDGLVLPSDLLDSNDCSTHLKTFFNDVGDAIERLGGAVVPKFTWSVPRDVTWANQDRSLSCQTIDEVMLLLKSSNFITHDIDYAFSDCEDGDQIFSGHKLSLRRYIAIEPECEFRCFVKNNTLIGISQRCSTTFFQSVHLKKLSLQEKIVNFFNGCIRFKFLDENYAFDVFFDGRKRVRLMDFNVFGATTDAILFEWEELNNLSVKDTVEFRLVESLEDIQSTSSLQWHSYPLDLFHLSNGLDHNKYMDLLRIDDLLKSTDSDSD